MLKLHDYLMLKFSSYSSQNLIRLVVLILIHTLHLLFINEYKIPSLTISNDLKKSNVKPYIYISFNFYLGDFFISSFISRSFTPLIAHTPRWPGDN